MLYACIVRNATWYIGEHGVGDNLLHSKGASCVYQSDFKMFQPFNAKPVPSDIFKENMLKNEKNDVPAHWG